MGFCVAIASKCKHSGNLLSLNSTPTAILYLVEVLSELYVYVKITNLRKQRKKAQDGSSSFFLAFIIASNCYLSFVYRGPAPKWVFKLFLAVASGLLGAFLSFPGMRLANMYLDSLFYCKETRVML